MNCYFGAEPWPVCGTLGLLSPAIMVVVELRFGPPPGLCMCREPSHAGHCHSPRGNPVFELR